jgi:PadR family transcriptional regulator PadR
MSRKLKSAPTARNRSPGTQKKADRYLQPSLLMALKMKPSYGYELIQEISRFGFIEGHAPPGMIYRHLRDLEENGLVASQWETEGSGPAKRIYELTAEGEAILAYWIDYMDGQAKRLSAFVLMYRNLPPP